MPLLVAKPVQLPIRAAKYFIWQSARIEWHDVNTVILGVYSFRSFGMGSALSNGSERKSV